jgi:hypothetical protein
MQAPGPATVSRDLNTPARCVCRSAIAGPYRYSSRSSISSRSTRAAQAGEYGPHALQFV